MRRHSPPRYSPPPRRGYGGYEGRGRSPPRRGHGGYGRHKEQGHGSLLVRNIPLDCRAEELRVPFERFGVVRDVYLPRDYYSGEPRGFAFVEFVDPFDAADAQYRMDGEIFAGRRISVVVAAESRKRPQEMRHRNRGPGHGGRRANHGRSRSRSRSPHYPSESRGRHRSRSYSPAPRRQVDYDSPGRRQADDRSRSPRVHPQNRDRSYSPGHNSRLKEDQLGNGKPRYDNEEQARWKSSRSPSGSRSRSADESPRRR